MIKLKTIELRKEDFKGKEYLFEYETNSYIDIEITDNRIELIRKSFPETIKKSFKSSLFSDWLELPIAYGAYDNGKLLGFIEGSIESWNNRFRITNILVFKEYRNKGIGQSLLNILIEYSKTLNTRMIVLETQSCNTKAIDFYHKNGFSLIGFDLYNYSNEDLIKKEVRIEMGKMISKIK